MAFDYKKEYKEFYLPPTKPCIVPIPAMNFVTVRGSGNPNDEDGEYKAALELLYGIAFTLKMSYKGSHHIDGYFEYVVPPMQATRRLARRMKWASRLGNNCLKFCKFAKNKRK